MICGLGNNIGLDRDHPSERFNGTASSHADTMKDAATFLICEKCWLRAQPLERSEDQKFHFFGSFLKIIHCSQQMLLFTLFTVPGQLQGHLLKKKT